MLSMLTGVDEPHHRCAKLTIAIATLHSAAAELYWSVVQVAN